MTFRPLGSIALLIMLGFASAACGVNEMPQYRDRIQNVHIAPRVDRTAEILFVSPNVIDPNDPDSVALSVLEQRVRERLGERLARLGHPDVVESTFARASDAQFKRRFQWDVVGADALYDTLFLVAVERYGVSVDAQGVSVVFFDTEISGRYVETGALIYEETVRSEIPLTDIYQGSDPVSGAAARVMNLMALDQMSDAEFQHHLLVGVERAAGYLMDELYDDTWQ